jgi:hypothetical protein
MGFFEKRECFSWIQRWSHLSKPRVWWHWMNGDITREGIRLDLEWMKRVGIGGVSGW